MRKQLLAISIFSSVASTQAQKISLTESSFLDRTEFKAGYTGNFLWNNGMQVGAEYLWKENIKTKDRSGKQKTNTHQFLFDGNLAVTTNFASRTDTGVFANFGLMWRRTNTKGKQFSIGLNPLGYYRSFLPETFEVNGNDVDKVFLPGRSYYAPSLSIGLGRFREHKKISGRYLNLNVHLRTPYNTGTLPSVSIQYGFRFNFTKNR